MAKEPEIDITLRVNGEDIGMNEFVRKITGNLLLAVLNSLRLDEEPKTATFDLKIKS